MPAVKTSLVHPRYKTEYRVRNWREYERGLRGRGDVTIWFSNKAIGRWISRSSGAPGGPRLYSDLAVRACRSRGRGLGQPRSTEPAERESGENCTSASIDVVSLLRSV